MSIKIRTFADFDNFKATLEECPPLKMERTPSTLDLKKHEWLEHDDLVKPYYDVDYNVASEPEWELAQKEIGEKWVKILGDKFPSGDLAISTCHREKSPHELSKLKKGTPWFISFHFVVNGYRIKMGNMEKLNASLGFWDPKKRGTKKILVDGYDNTVYSNGQNFRMVYQSKPGSTALQIPSTMEGAQNVEKHSIQYSLEWDDSQFYQNVNVDTIVLVPSEEFPLVEPQTAATKKTVEPKSVAVKKTVAVKKNVAVKKTVEVKKTKELEVEDASEITTASHGVYDKEQLKKVVFRITSRYDYDDWLKVLFGVYNITGGDDFGLAMIHEWSALDDGYDGSFIDSEYKWLNKKANDKTNKIGFGTLVKWAEIDNPTNIFKSIYLSNCALDEGGKPTEDSPGPNVDGLVDELNKELIFVKETGEYIILDSKLDGTPCWFLKGVQKVTDHFNKYSFKDPFTNRKANPFKIWSENLRRREVIRIGFNPENTDDPDIFNLWKGFAISHEDCAGANIDDCAPMLDHIRHIWCKGSDELFNYVMNYFARIIQMPHKKSGVMLCLKSKQGAGKGVVIEAIGKIIGDAHYAQVSNANNVFGDFNGTLEAKILVDLDEAFWGGDKKLEGIIKNKITEKRQIVNKKNKEAYSIDDYANYVLTSNNDRFASASSPEDRRHYCIELDNKYAGRMTKEVKEYFEPIAAVQEDEGKLKALAKYLYEKNLSDFNPRIFNKTPLLQDQIQQSWNTVQKWWFAVLNDGGFDCDKEATGFCIFNKLYYQNNEHQEHLTGMTRTKYKKDARGKKISNPSGHGHIIEQTQVLYYKDFLYDCYAKVAGSGYNKLDKGSFFRAMKQDCLEDLLVEVKPKANGGDNKRISYIHFPEIRECQAMFNKIQGFEYIYQEIDDDDWE